MVPGQDCRLSAVKTTSTFRAALYEVLGISVAKPSDPGPIMSGSPAQIIQSIFNQAFRLFSPRLIQLVVEESTSGRTFLWQSELQKEGYSIVNSEEFDHSSADPYLQVIPNGDWILQTRDTKKPLRVFETNSKKQTVLTEIPDALLDTFRSHKVILSVAVALGDEWQGRLVICDAHTDLNAHTNLDVLRTFGKTMSRSIHAAHLCLRACREAAAEERSRLARELHDGTIQSLLGVELRLESLRRNLAPLPEIQRDIAEVQGILRREATDLRKMVNETRRRALSPERLLEFLSDLLERFQRETGVITRFFADLQNDRMPSRICHEIARMAEEGITNARKYAKASTITVRVGSVGDNWLLVMVDDGVGFDFRGTWTLERLVTAGLGPRVIKERVRSLGGNLIIESTPTGARIEVSIPKSSGSVVPFRSTNLDKTRHDESYSHTAR
jgi:signal transduction histidine kinase